MQSLEGSLKIYQNQFLEAVMSIHTHMCAAARVNGECKSGKEML